MKKTQFKRTLSLVLVIHFTLLIFHSSLNALDVKRDVLENGLTLLTVERHSLPIVKVTVGIKAGSLEESGEKAGLANLTAELLTSGTKTRKASQINEEIDFAGGSLSSSGGDDYVTVNLSILKKDINPGFDLLSDVILNPLFSEAELDKKRERIKGRLRAREDDPGFVASKEFRKAVFGTHPYGRLITGSAETLGRITRQDIVDFHSAYYVPGNAVMSVVGDITSKEVRNLIEKYFSEWHPVESKVIPSPEPEKIKKRKTIVVDKDLTQANIILGHIGIKRDNPDYYAVSVMNYILGGGGFASRLVQNIREDKGLAYDIHSFFSADRYGGSFQVGLQTKNDSANTAIKEILKEIKRIKSRPVSDSELSDAKAFLTGSFPVRIETSRRIAGFLVAVEYYGLGIDYMDNYPHYINSVTKGDVLEAARKYLDPENYVLVVVADQEKAQLNINSK